MCLLPLLSSYQVICVGLHGANQGASEVKVTVLSFVWNIPSIFGGWALFVTAHGKLLTSSQFMKDVQSLPWMSAYFGLTREIADGLTFSQGRSNSGV